MSFVTPLIALFFFIAIILISAILAIRLGAHINYERGSLHTFIAILTGLGVFVTFMFYYSVVELQQQQQALAKIQETTSVTDMFSATMDAIETSSLTIPQFALSLNPL